MNIISLLTFAVLTIVEPGEICQAANSVPRKEALTSARVLVEKTKLLIEHEIEAHSDAVAQLESLNKLAQVQLEKLQKLSESIESLSSKNEDAIEQIIELAWGLRKKLKRVSEEGQQEVAGRDGRQMLSGEANFDVEAFFKAAAAHVGEKNWEKALNLAVETWSIFNESMHHGRSLPLPGDSLLKIVVVSASKMKKWSLAISACETALKTLILSKDKENFFKENLSSIKDWIRMEKIRELSSMTEEEQIKFVKNIAERVHGYDLCQRDTALNISRNLAANPKLFCRYDNRNGHPLLLISPLREEILSLDPVVVLLYDIFLPEEIEILKAEANRNLKPSFIGDTESDILIRKTDVSWVDIIPSLVKLTRRIEAFTGLNPDNSSAESYQVAHYGVAGHYRPHLDSTKDIKRIATLLGYLAEVEEGGATVFVDLNLHVTPVAGAGLFWYNHHKNLTLDMRTRHAACPVIRKEKWITNKWFRYPGQFLHRPSGKRQKDDFTLDDCNLPTAIQKDFKRYATEPSAV